MTKACRPTSSIFAKSMRILYISAESPLTPAGGIATYLKYIVPSMLMLGHEAFLFTWIKDQDADLYFQDSPFPAKNIWLVSRDEVGALDTEGPNKNNHAFGMAILPHLLRCIDEWNIDVIEATDYLSPALALFQHINTKRVAKSRLCVTYNHGFVEDFFDSDYMRPSPAKLRDLSGERQQCRISDIVITPSQCAAARLDQHGIFPPEVARIREPYVFAAARTANHVAPALTYMGRIALSKGIDAAIFFANTIHSFFPLERIRLIGNEVTPPFRCKDLRDYVRRRLTGALSECLEFRGFLPRDQALALLSPGDMAPHLGSADTFSYACVESIDHGLVPIVRAGTPMAEFFPAELRHLVFPADMGTPSEIHARFEALQDVTGDISKILIEHNADILAPERIARAMSDTYAQALSRKQGRVQAVVAKRPFSTEDVTILIPAYRPGSFLMETVDSIAAQTTGAPKVLICNDGTPVEEADWFMYASMRLAECEIIEQPNGGLLAARMTLIKNTRTELAVFVDADDILAPRYLERTLEALNTHPREPDAIITQRTNFDEGSETSVMNFLNDYMHLLENDFRMTALIKTRVLRDLGFCVLRRNGEADDWDFWLRFTAAGYTAAMVPEPLFRYRFRRGTMSWPWSTGQEAGTNFMLRESVTTLLRQRPEFAPLVAKALSAARTIG